MKNFIRPIAGILLFILATPAIFAQQRLPIKQFTSGMHIIHAEVASTEAQRETGLMNRTQMGQNNGMMFIFDRPNNYCMWMKNTLIPLSVAFINSEGIILNIEEMQPQTETNHCAKGPALYALEMNTNWFHARHIKPRTKIAGLN